MNLPIIQNPPLTLTLLMNQTEGPTIVTISIEPRTQDVDITIVTFKGAMMGDDGPQPQVRLARKNKETFDIMPKKRHF